MSYLAPPPMPAPVVVTKDVGGYVADYQTQTALYRMTGREVRLHECRSACTMALSLPNVCVYPDSVLKFHQAYDPRNHEANLQVSQQLFDSYPAAVQARLGTLTREYRVLRGSELIALGIRNCNEPKGRDPKIIVASAPAAKPAPSTEASGEKPFLAGLFDKVKSILGTGADASAGYRQPGLRRQGPSAVPALAGPAEAPLPPERPAEFGPPAGALAAGVAESGRDRPAGRQKGEPEAASMRVSAAEISEPVGVRAGPATSADARSGKSGQSRAEPAEVISGAQPILPQGFIAYADSGR